MSKKEVKKITKKAVLKKAVKKTNNKAVKRMTAKTIKKGSAKKVTKKTIKKSAVKKSIKKSPKKVILKSKLRKAHGEKQFFLSDGQIISDLLTLADAFDGMVDDVFYHHVNNERNDFANWVNDILEEQKLAEQLTDANNKERCQIIVLRHLLK